jgi:hypothetical protein
MNADQVATNLWVGAAPADPKEVDKKFDALVLAAEEFQDIFPAHKYPGTHLILAPMKDAKPTSEEKVLALQAGLRVYELNKAGKRVLVTCAKGVNRSALVAALAMVIGGLKMEKAIGMIRKHRKPVSKAVPLFNEHFVSFIRALSDALSSRKD